GREGASGGCGAGGLGRAGAGCGMTSCCGVRRTTGALKGGMDFLRCGRRGGDEEQAGPTAEDVSSMGTAPGGAIGGPAGGGGYWSSGSGSASGHASSP